MTTAVSDKVRTEPLTGEEALLAEILAEQFEVKKNIRQADADMQMRIATTQYIIEEHLEKGSQAFDKYVNAANAHFSRTKDELRATAQGELKQTITTALIEAHQHLLLISPPKITIRGLWQALLLAALVGSAVGIASGLATYQWSGKGRLTPDEIRYIQKGQMLEQAWPMLSRQTKKRPRTSRKPPSISPSLYGLTTIAIEMVLGL